MCDDRTEIEANGFPTRLHPEPEDEARTDADGRYELDPTRPGSAEGQRFFQRDPGTPGAFAVLCDADGHALAEVSPLEIDPIVGLDGVDVVLGPGGSIEGQVLVARGKDAAGIVVAIDRTDGRARTQRVGLDGLYRFDRLTPGRWNVVRTEEEIHSGSRSASWSHGDEPVTPKLPWNCTVTEGETTRFEIDLTDDRPCALLARVLVGSAPAAGWSIVLLPERGATARAHPSGIVDSAGNARLEAEEPGSFGVHLAPPPGSEARFSVPLVLARGDNAHTVRIEVGTVRGQVLVPSAGASVRLHGVSTSTEGLAFGARVVPAADGRFEIPFVLAGRMHISLVQDSADGVAEPIAKEVLEVPAGGIVEVELP
jgi:hypothetical protein